MGLDRLSPREERIQEFHTDYVAAWKLSGQPPRTVIDDVFDDALDDRAPKDTGLHPLWNFMRGYMQSNSVPLAWFRQFPPDREYPDASQPLKGTTLIPGIGKTLEESLRNAFFLDPDSDSPPQ